MFHTCSSTQCGLHYVQERNEQLVQEWTSILCFWWWKHTICHVVMCARESFLEPSMNHFIAGNKKKFKKVQRKSPLYTHTHSLYVSPPSCLSHTSSRTKTPFNHGETWQQISASILHLINGNDSSVIHHPGWHFFFLFIYLFFLAQGGMNSI